MATPAIHHGGETRGEQAHVHRTLPLSRALLHSGAYTGPSAFARDVLRWVITCTCFEGQGSKCQQSLWLCRIDPMAAATCCAIPVPEKGLLQLADTNRELYDSTQVQLEKRAV